MPSVFLKWNHRMIWVLKIKPLPPNEFFCRHSPEPSPAGSQFNPGNYHHPRPDLTASYPCAGGEYCAPSLWSPVLCMTWHIPGLMKSSLNQNIYHKKKEICSSSTNFYLWLSTTGYTWVSGLSKSSSIAQSKAKGSFGNPVPFFIDAPWS